MEEDAEGRVHLDGKHRREKNETIDRPFERHLERR